MRLCKISLSKRVWIRKLVRKLGFLTYPDYDVEDIEICVVNWDGSDTNYYRVTGEDDNYYYVINPDAPVTALSKPKRSNTFITGKVFYEKGFKAAI
jgi:hypothetical protein